MAIEDVPVNKLIEKAAQELKNIKEITPPTWATYVKTGIHKQRPPVMDDWWYYRTAAILRKITLKGPIGVSKLRVYFGGKQNRGVRPEKFKRAGGSILRKVLQQLEAAGLAKQAAKGVHKGRISTPKGLSLLGKASDSIMKEMGIEFKPIPKTELNIPDEKKKKKKKRATKKRAPRKRAVKKEAPVKEAPKEEKKEAPKEEKKEAKVEEKK